MLRNYLKIAFRNLRHNKLYTLINICGLALGLTCCILISLLVQNEWSFDRHHKKKDHIYRVITREVRPQEGTVDKVLQPFTLAEGLTADLPGVIRASGFSSTGTRVAIKDKVIGRRVAQVDPPFLQMFTFPLIAGDPTTALNNPDAILITESSARRLFDLEGSDYSSIMGESLTVQETLTFVITGILKDLPNTSSLRFDILINNDHYQNFGGSDDWGANTSMYIEIEPNQNLDGIRAVLPNIVKTHLKNRMENFRNAKRIVDTDDAYQLRLQPLTDVYNNESIRSNYERRGIGSYLYILSGIAIGILFIACINFTTLSIGQSTSRALEVGMRKVLGAHRRQVMGQFWSEALLLTTAALALAIVLTEALLPTFNDFARKTLILSYASPDIWVLLLGLIVIVGLTAGSYPSLVLSSFQAIDALKGQISIGGRQLITRALVVVQYTLAIVLLIGTGVMLQQIHYMQNTDLGFDHEQVLLIQSRGKDAHKTAQRYKNVLAGYSGIVSITLSDRSFTNGKSATGFRDKNDVFIPLRRIRIDEDYAETFQLQFVAGRDFTTDADSRNIVVNERLVKRLELENPIGQPLKGYRLGRNLEDPIIMGIVKDFHIDKLDSEIKPLVLYTHPTGNSLRSIFIRIRPENAGETLDYLKSTWEKVAPSDVKYQHQFLDENLDQQYQSEQRANQIISYAALLTILISCLGLLGLASLAVTKRTKEVGVRKVLGASIPRLVGLLSWDFIKLLVIANIIAWPIAYWMMNRWLTAFAYRIDLGPTVFLAAGLVTIGIAFATVSFKTIRAARSNPIDALRYE